MLPGKRVDMYSNGELIGEATVFDPKPLIKAIQAMWNKFKKGLMELSNWLSKIVKKVAANIERFSIEIEITRLNSVLKVTKQTNARRKLIKRRKVLMNRLQE